MKAITALAVIIFTALCTKAQVKNEVPQYSLPDSAKAVSLIAATNIAPGKRPTVASLKANRVSVTLASGKKHLEVAFAFPAAAKVVAKGLTVKSRGLQELYWHFTPKAGNSYKLLLVSTGDSAEQFMLYSGYICFSDEQKWKLLGTCRIKGEWTPLKGPVAFVATPGDGERRASLLRDVWYQQRSGQWKALFAKDTIPPVLPPFSNTDSTKQFAIEKEIIARDIAAGKTDVREYKDGVYYRMMKTGTGKTVSVTDTVTVFYKGYLYADGKVFDQTKEKPARFPLNRLIKGWQLGLPLCATGGTIKLVILSGQAYAIRTRAAKIPPNSILVFEIEVVKAEGAL